MIKHYTGTFNTKQLREEIEKGNPKWVDIVKVHSEPGGVFVLLPEDATSSEQTSVDTLATNHVAKNSTQLKTDQVTAADALVTKLKGLGLTDAEAWMVLRNED